MLKIFILAILISAICGSTAPINPVSLVSTTLRKTVTRLYEGTKDLLSQFKEADELKKLRKKFGDSGLSFTQFKQIEKAKEDFSKLLKLGITIPISPQFFFYSYLLFPMMTPSNPWAWRAFPSTYDQDEKDIKTRTTIIHKRRIELVLKSLTQMEHDVNEDYNEKNKKFRQDQINLLKKCLSSSSIDQSLSQITLWLQTESKKTSKLHLLLNRLPNNLVFDCCKALGMEPLPNVPIVKRFNVGELSGYMDKLKESDLFINKIGINKLNNDEVLQACEERCIYHDGRPVSALKSDLQQWLKLTTDASPSSSVTSTSSSNSSNNKKKQNRSNNGNQLVVNEQNRRFALMGIHMVKGCSLSKENELFKSALSYKG